MDNKKIKYANCSFIDGVGSTQAIDTAGEIVDLAGIDCSSLIGGPFNWEHKSDIPAQIVGKILEYKKIFSEADCENERHKYYFGKVKGPYLYVMGRLFDDKKDSSKECAALFIDDSEHPNEHPMVGFSIEGSKIDKSNIIVTKSIARKITITNLNANKQCFAELIPAEQPKKNDPESIFKSEFSNIIELLGKSEELKKKEVPGSKHPSMANAKMNIKTASAPMKYGPIENNPEKNLGQKIGETKSGKPIMSHAKPTDYKDFSAQDHQDAGNLHFKHAEEGKGIPGAKHFDTAKRHMAMAGRNERQSTKAIDSRKQALDKPDLNSNRMWKGMSAGSGMGSPATLTQGAALGKEKLDKKMNKKERCWNGYEPTPGKKPYSKGSCQPIKKSEWLKRAKEEYKNWSKREEFESFMSKSMPNLVKSEIQAIGQMIALNKALKAEKQLKKMMPANTNMDSYVEKKEKK